MPIAPNTHLEITSTPRELLFSSGFGGSTRLAPAVGPYFHGAREQYEDIVGTDASLPLPFAWNEISNHPNLGHLRIYYEGGDATQRSAEIISDNANPLKKILRFRLSEPNVTIDWGSGPERKARVQAELYGNKDLREFYQTVRLRLHPDMQVLEQFPTSFHWFTLFEFWNQPFWDHPYPFRISVSMSKPNHEKGSGLFFAADAQKMLDVQKFESIWMKKCESFRIPYATWMNIEIYYREGDDHNGRLYMAVTPEGGERCVLMDVRNYTHHPDNPSPAGLTHYNPMKVYTSAEVVEFMREQGCDIQVDWDDLSFWKGRQPPESLANPALDARRSNANGGRSKAVIVNAGTV